VRCHERAFRSMMRTIPSERRPRMP
jgi:hypothetical protein